VRPRALLRAEDGQAIPEFSLVLLPVVLILLGIAWFGIALNDWIDETHLANEGARYAAVNQNPGGTNVSLEEWITSQIRLGNPGCESKCQEHAEAKICSPTSTAGDWVEVKLKYPYNWLPIFKLSSTEIQLESAARMRIEVPPASPYNTTC
jgi:hypothetical protein